MVSRIVAVLAAAAVGWCTTAVAAQDAELAWRWDAGRHHRFYVDTEVQLPVFMWFITDYNQQARVVAFQVRTVLDCSASGRDRPHAHEVRCRVDDISLRASALAGDVGLLTPILDEMDEKLSGATLELVFHDDGRLLNVGLDGLAQRNRRSNAMRENMRLMMGRVAAGLDVRLPRGPVADGDVWTHRSGWQLQLPSSQGTRGFTRLTHQATPSDDGVLIRTSGGGTIAPGEMENLYKMTYTGAVVFSPERGSIVARRWEASGGPTPSSWAAEGSPGIPYVHRGAVVLLDLDASVDVGVSEEVLSPGGPVNALQSWMYLGEPAGVPGAVGATGQ